VIAARRVAATALWLCFACPFAARAQAVPPPPPAPDTAARSAEPARKSGWPYLERGLVPVEPEAVAPGPLPPGSRYTFTRDSMTWSGAQTLSDLLAAIPGVYLARGGFLGLPEYLAFAGRGAAAVRAFWDGLPLEPLGGDSLYLDLAHIPLTYLRRVDVEVLPAELRVYLVSERDETLAARSLVRVMSGDFRSAAYTGLFQKRWTSGLGLDLAGHFVGSDGASGPGRKDQAFDLWGKVEWLASPTTGASYQVRRQQVDRDPVVQGKGGVPVSPRIPASHGTRTDALLSLFASSRPFDMGWRARAGLGSSGWSDDSVVGPQSIHQAFVTLGYRDPRATLEATGRLADARTPVALEARLGWSPVPGLSLAADGALRRHDGGRHSRAAHAAAALGAGPFALIGEWALQRAVQAPALLQDTAQRTADRAVRARFETRPVSVDLGLVRRDAYQPLAFPDLKVIPALAPSRAATYVVAQLRLQPIEPISLQGWYATPRRAGPPALGAADFQPPTHGRAELTFRSKFWRTFRSGAFDLEVQMAMESWSRGRAGLDLFGQPIELPGTTYYETRVAFQIVGFTAFWDLRDAYNARRQYVPGLDYPNNAQVFGVRWEFRN
jgi:hypothetical protein